MGKFKMGKFESGKVYWEILLGSFEMVSQSYMVWIKLHFPQKFQTETPIWEYDAAPQPDDGWIRSLDTSGNSCGPQQTFWAMFHPTKLPHTLALGSWSLGLAGTGAYCTTYYMVQAMEYWNVLVLPTIYYYIYGPGYGILPSTTITYYKFGGVWARWGRAAAAAARTPEPGSGTCSKSSSFSMSLCISRCRFAFR